MDLQTAFEKICRDHDVTTVAFSRSSKVSPAYQYGATVHWNGYARDGNPCEAGHGPSIAAAFSEAIAKMRVCRTPEAGDVLPDNITVELAA